MMELVKASFALIEGSDLVPPIYLLYEACAFVPVGDINQGIVAFPTLETKAGQVGGRIPYSRWQEAGFVLHDLTDIQDIEAQTHSLRTEGNLWMSGISDERGFYLTRTLTAIQRIEDPYRYLSWSAMTVAI